jgi:hypothetical protein
MKRKRIPWRRDQGNLRYNDPRWFGNASGYWGGFDGGFVCGVLDGLQVGGGGGGERCGEVCLWGMTFASSSSAESKGM